MSRRTHIAIPILLVGAVLASSATPAGASAAGRSAADRRLQASLEALVGRDDGPPGAIAVVQRGDTKRIFRAGVSNLETGAPMQPWMNMRIASTAKAYSGGVALSLVEEGVMSLDDTVGELLPWTNPDWHPVTLAQALHHTSGLPTSRSRTRSARRSSRAPMCRRGPGSC